MAPRSEDASAAPPTFQALEATGGWAVEIQAGKNTDVAMFRSERAKTVSVEGRTTTGTAALSRRQPANGEDWYVMGQ